MFLLSALLTFLALLLSTALFSYYILLTLCVRLLGRHLLAATSSKRSLLLSSLGEADNKLLVGFFHPYCNAGGGGERVLWAAIRTLQTHHPEIMAIVYTGDHDATKTDILSRVESRFSIELDPSRITFLYLEKRRWVAAATWPRFTLAGQSLGSLVLAYEAMGLCVPDVFVDTMGYAFTMPLVRGMFGKGVRTAAYVHYPTISTDMLGALPGASLKTRAKRAYWNIFATAYAACGNSVDLVMVNSSWTAGHMRHLWPSKRISIVFPPCAVSEIAAATTPEVDKNRRKVLLCIAQFRPEKRHEMLIDAFAGFRAGTKRHKDAKLVLVGSVRHGEDALRVYELKIAAREKGVAEEVVFVTDASWAEVQAWLAEAYAGVNAMWNEHFGIGVVEYLAAGLVGVVHDSGGPKMDIVTEGTGWHCSDETEFARAFERVFETDQREVVGMRRRARESAKRFDEQTFERRWREEFGGLLAR